MAAVERRHIEAHKLWLAVGRARRESPWPTVTIRHRLGMLRTFFERLRDWDYDDAPSPDADLPR